LVGGDIAFTILESISAVLCHLDRLVDRPSLSIFLPHPAVTEPADAPRHSYTHLDYLEDRTTISMTEKSEQEASEWSAVYSRQSCGGLYLPGPPRSAEENRRRGTFALAVPHRTATTPLPPSLSISFLSLPSSPFLPSFLPPTISIYLPFFLSSFLPFFLSSFLPFFLT
jgi:hypothetical protein